MRISVALSASLLVVVAFLAAQAARAQVSTSLTATLTPVAGGSGLDALSPQAASPVSAGGGTGTASFIVDRTTRMLRWQVTYGGLSSDAVAAHIHTVAGPGVTPTIVLDLAQQGMNNPLVGSASVDETLLTDLLAGRDFVDIHTKLNQGGELTGQITP